MSWTKKEQGHVSGLEVNIHATRDYVNGMERAQNQKNQIVDHYMSRLNHDSYAHESRLFKLETFVEGFWLTLKILLFVAATAAVFGLGVLAG